MEMPSAQVFIHLVAAVTGLFLAGCSNPDEPFFQVNNPFTFQEEAQAVRQLFSRQSEEVESEEREPRKSGPVYFRGDTAVGAAARATNPETPATATPRQATGASGICYRCNGKGYRVAVQGQEAGEFQDCPYCHGSGRVP